MKSTIHIVRAGLLLALAALPLYAIDGVTVWEKTFHREVQGAGNQWPMTARELADGTTLTVTSDNSGVTALNYDHAGQLLASSSFYPVYGATIAAIDPFGGVFVVAEATAGYLYETDLWVMKYDGLTGRALWPAAVVFGAGNQQDDEIMNLFVDPAGDVVLQVTDILGNATSLLKYGGVSGNLSWGPVKVLMYQSNIPLAALDGDGNVYLTGRALDFFVTKFAAATGEIVWSLKDPEEGMRPVAIGLDASGNVLVAGQLYPDSFEACKYAGATGQRIWGPARYTADSETVSLSAAAIGSDGSVVMFGSETNIVQSVSELLVKLRGADGGQAWAVSSVTDPTENFQQARLTLAGDGDPILDVPFNSGQSFQDVKSRRFVGSTGSIVWGPQSLAHADFVRSFVGSNGRVFATASVFNGTNLDLVLLERNGSTGAPAWGPITFDGAAAGYTHFWDLTASPDGNVVVTGSANAASGGAWATLKYEKATGNILWGPEFFPSGGPGASPFQVLADASGDVLVAGRGNGGMQVVKYSGSTGAQLWVSTAISGSEYGLALDASGNAFITGWSGTGGGDDIYTTKISGADGSVLWGPAIFDSGAGDFPDRIATGPSGDVFVIGHSDSDGYPNLVLKYSGVDGSLLWGPIIHAGGQPSGIAVDAAGDLFEETSEGITTTKYDGATGELLWGPLTVGGPGSGYGAWVAVDTSGNVFATGSLYGGPATRFDYATIKYRGSDGAVLWGPVTYDGGEGNDGPYAVAVDGDGNPAVAGTAGAGSNERRTATLSYDGATGALRWGPIGQNIARQTVNGLAASGSTIYVGATRGDVGFIVTALDETLGIATIQDGIPAAACGHALDLPIVASNGTPPYAWSIASGALPPDVTLGSSGHLAGAPSQEGSFSFRVRVQDAAMASASRDFTMVVGPGSDLVPITASTDEACQITLSVSGSFAGYSWLPGGETTPTITVDPTETTTYGVVLDDGSACRSRGAVTIAPQDLACLSPAVLSISPSAGPGPGTPIVVAGSKFQTGASVSVAGLPATGVVFESASAIDAVTPSLAPGTVGDVLVVNTDGRYGLLLRGFAADFLDVPSSNPFYADIMRVLRAGITAGCGGGGSVYCPGGAVSRAQMAVFLLKAEHGFFHVPPPCAGVFADVACPGAFAVDWIEQLAAEGITGGCGNGNYCPDAVVNRAQMSAFLLKSEHGSSYVPPPCAGIFGDVPCGAPFADWIEQLFHEGITGGCGGGNYCPSSPNTRGQMAVFLSKTFALP